MWRSVGESARYGLSAGGWIDKLPEFIAGCAADVATLVFIERAVIAVSKTRALSRCRLSSETPIRRASPISSLTQRGFNVPGAYEYRPPGSGLARFASAGFRFRYGIPAGLSLMLIKHCRPSIRAPAQQRQIGRICIRCRLRNALLIPRQYAGGELTVAANHADAAIRRSSKQRTLKT